jgi:hypothetical protein
VVLRIQAQLSRSPLQDSHLLRSRFPTRSSCVLFFVACPTTPGNTNSPWFGLFPVRSPLLRVSRLISSRRATEMFQFTRCPPHSLCVQLWVERHDSLWVAPFGFSRFNACMQLPLNVSPVSASFFGFKHQGIHLVLMLACSLLVCSVSSVSTRADAHACSKIEGLSYLVGKVLVGFSKALMPGPQPLESGNQSETVCAVPCLLFPKEEPTWDDGYFGIPFP